MSRRRSASFVVERRSPGSGAQAQKDLVEIVHTLRQVVCVKG
jgi:hypothetical protein